ncbi:MAG TPA: PP0621 family protein [Burkholderiales bacterium]|nr:PP0621 family protein [Burkholderiales bacterium]
MLVLVLVAAYWIFKAYKRKAGSASRGARRGRTAEDMVRCAQCGVHLPRSESLASEGAFFCTPEHRRLHQKPD